MKYARCFFSLIFVAGMLAVSEYTGEREIIFPEVLALLAGAWIMEHQPWVSGPWQFFCLMSGAAGAGVLLVRFCPGGKLVQAAIALALTGLALTLFRSTLSPMVSACILPILLGTTSWIYPLSVGGMTLLILLIQWGMGKLGLRPEEEEQPVEFHAHRELRKWSLIWLVFLVTAALPIAFHQLYFIAPPLIVTFVIGFQRGSPVEKMPLRVWGQITLAAVVGTIARLVLAQALHWPFWLAGGAAALLLFLAFEGMRLFFPPAGAVLLLPFLLPVETLWAYPVEVCLGCGVFLGAARLLTLRKVRKWYE